jgi:cell division protein FtsQ
MPAVKRKTPAKKKPAAKKRTPARRRAAPQGGLQALGARLDDALRGLWSAFVTYTAVGLTALALIVLLMLFAGGYFWNVGERIETLTGRAVKAAGFAVTRVTVKGADNISDRAIMQALWSDADGSVIGRSLLHLDAEEARDKIERIGWVRAAAVQKLWPNTVHISVREHRPAALWQNGLGELWLVDLSGRKLDRVAMTDYTELAVISGTDDPGSAYDILVELQSRPDLKARVAGIVSVGDRRYDLRFRNDFTAKLPDDDIGRALDRLDGLGAGTGKLSASLDYIDLRDPKWAYVKPKS